MNDQDHRQGSLASYFTEPAVHNPMTGLREEESLRSLVQVLRKRSVFIAIAAVIGLLLALALCIVIPVQYSSTATLLISKDQAGGVNLGSLSDMASALGGGDDLKTDIQTHATLLQSDATVLQVIRELHLQERRPYKYTPSILDLHSQLRAEMGRPLDSAPATQERMIKVFDKHLKVAPVQDTRLITVEFRGRDPQEASLIANKLVDVYIQKYLQTKFQATAAASDWLSSQLADLKKQAEDSQAKLSDYERKTGLSVLMLGVSGSGESGANSVGGGVHIPQLDRLAALNAELTAAEANRIAKEAIYRLTESESPDVVLGIGNSDLASVGGGSSVVSQGSGLALLHGLRQQQAALQMEYSDAVTKYGARNPHLTELKAQSSALQGQIQAEMQRIRQQAHNDFTLAEQNEVSTQRAYSKQEATVSRLNDSTSQLEILAGEARSSRTLYNTLYTQLQEANVQVGEKATNLILADPARPGVTPTRPNWFTYPVLGMAVGLFFGLAGAFAWENLDDKVTSIEQIEQTSSYPVLTVIPELQHDEVPSQQLARESVAESRAMDHRMLLSNPHSAISEAFRALRTAIQLSSAGRPLQVILVTSPMAGDGKSHISTNLAVAFTLQNKRVLLIDADLRKPVQAIQFGLPRSPGLTEVLAGARSLEECVAPVDSVPGLSVLVAGTSPPNPSELLDSSRMDDLLTKVRHDYDLVIIDSPPALFVTDAVIIAGKVDGTVVTVRAKKTTKPAIVRVCKYLAQSDGRKLGFILNGVNTHSSEYYYSYGYHGDNGYYTEEAKRS